MFFLRYNWTLSPKVQIAIGTVLLAALALLLALSGREEAFAALDGGRCVQQPESLAQEACGLR